MYDPHNPLHRHFNDSPEDRWEAELRVAAEAPRSSPPCPECNSLLTAPSAAGRTWLGIAGAVAGAAGGATEAIFRSAGSLRSPANLPVATLALATLAALAGATSGFTLGIALGQRLDTLLGRHRCNACGHRYRVVSSSTRELATS